MTNPADAEARAAAVFEALADPTRRAVLRDVAEQGPRTATELAAELPVSRQAVAKHLTVLHEAGLQIPHPRLHERLFVLEPLLELDPELVVPEKGGVQGLLARLK